MENPRFPPAWSVDDDKKLGQDCYVRDADGHALAYVYLEQEPNARQFEISPAIHL
jgi:hypothetical protein